MPGVSGPDPIILGLTADSRAVRPGFLFAALPGSRQDGRDFIPAALASGAVALLVPAGHAVADLPPGVALIHSPNPRRRLALLAAAFAGAQPETMVAVTGTNGKTSTAWFFRRIMAGLGHPAAAIGTLGVIADGWDEAKGGMTTPDPVELHRILARLAGLGVTHASLEASSHGLDQERLDGVRLKAAAFTNLTRDHLDYHRDMEAYAAAKRRLFTELLPGDGVAVIDMDGDWSPYFAAAARARGLRLITTGAAGEDIRLIEATPTPTGQTLRLGLFGREVSVALPLAGRFQAHNALSALGLAVAIGAEPARALAALERLDGVPGRLQRVAARANGAAIYVDYAHTPDALETVLRALRPHATGRLVALFGCGGDRDPGKRGLMGSIAGRLADRVLITDDNPRGEDPARIRSAILAGCLGGIEIADRRAAIGTAVAGLEAGDLLVIAGKGHETGQIVGDQVLPFDDAVEARAAALAADRIGGAGPLWTGAEAAAATGGHAEGRAWSAGGVSIDSRSLQPGELFVALRGPSHDGHDHVAAALAAGAAAALVERRPDGLAADAPLLRVADSGAALAALAGAARARTTARVAAITGSVGKTGTKEMLALALAEQGPTHATAGNLNNHYGVPLSLARLPRDAAFAVFELGMNHPGELTPLAALVRPEVALITTVEAVHLEFFASTEAIADAKAEILGGVTPGGVAILPRDNRHYHRLAAAATERGLVVRSFGNHIDAHARLLDCGVDPDSTAVFALIGDRALAYRIGVPGRQWAVNSLAVLLAVEALGGDPLRAARALASLAAPKGRGRRLRLPCAGGGSVELIDESYNASPVSMNAAIAALAAARPAKGGRRLAVLGDMLELGRDSPALHAGLAEAIETWGIDLVYTAGPLMANLHAVLAESRRGGHADSADAAIPLVLAGLRPGDVVMVKGSAGSRMARVVQALTERVPGQHAV
ncbi:UDP-N-acetylmuramoyl-L-alanyl-D-glutamate--2,6-diaminopimelate ligase [Phaeospirillum tilakii]|uniref:UDP-N-acetylmuramoyl-L-alanyl-D-glutamate--2, 6-diaminopimelate ligase n=1 Tax=Phaeospirillum tilakii TaxID=741673 RepID=UPI003A921F81